MWLLLFLVSWGYASAPVCPNGFTLVNNKCLAFFKDPVDHAHAAKNCMSHGATLSTPKNAIDNRALANFVKGNSFVWIGIFCVDSDPSKCYWDDSTGAVESFNSFSPGFPEVDIGQCVYLVTDGTLAGKWLNGQCSDEPKQYVCELPTTVVPASNFCKNNYNGFCYYFNDPLPFAEAQQLCENECGNLVSVLSAQENRYLNTVVAPNQNFFIGANYSERSWKDGSKWDYNNVDSDYVSDNENCLAISNGPSNDVASGAWYSVPCADPRGFVCKLDATTKCDNPPVTVSPSINNPSGCNQGLLMFSGVITSPRYPAVSYDGPHCTYSLATASGSRIFLKFTEFSNSAWDVITVYDSDGKTSLGDFSGTSGPFSVKSSENTMTVKTNGNRYNTRVLFKASFASV
ncbi:Protein CBG10310 [Caenorhabditis briggsae]|uniref:Protein CBG10310 n=2 Tax=Caenorhabditis briggsae TaxID=6238 RepID=A8XAM6_CAEBR|nr:Protein CBG10310 [Caenorhabditis briggsae]ULU08359.1 hypothetical protein L3Y34_019494 [Caenorhabditis briggsae]CAP29691.1 Protein CBG10310 [Caenorhabditis briggsae]